MANSLKFIILIFLVQVGCKSVEKPSEVEPEIELIKENIIISEVKINAITRGHKEEVTVNSALYTFHSNSMNNTNKVRNTMTLTAKEWAIITEMISKIDLNQINSLKSPTENRMFDGDLATTISFISDEKTYTSSVFDKKTPPEELSEIVKYIYSLNEE
ncbi:hypothetical protein SAMN04488096_10554 [Mesonia phycicola]|uniref:Uncharacterized protein n=1 Tax=Mesonia phycicola TaxID=579105 RepID=A0A1M6EES0_9FLAO|nr:hypothetical protein [Mesonia phycicola]SHI83972.1 hypothetical protein SAMN04488096_10554 [Mesonia phycicola]